MRHQLFNVLVCTVAAMPLVSRTATVHEDLPVLSGIFSIHLEADKSVYRVGEPINIRVMLINRTAHYYAVEWAPPYGVCRLVVVKDGRPISSRGAWGYSDLDPDLFELTAGRAEVVRYDDPGGRGLLEWASIDHWGYNLDQPGSYSITAVATLIAFERVGNSEGPEFTTSNDEVSNALRITIAK